MTLKCLACEHDNNAGDRFCGACGSSLDLQLCCACEAINGGNAKHCHNCGAELPEARQPLRAQALLPERLSRHAYEANPSPGGRIGLGMRRSLIAVPVLGIAAAAYYFHGQLSPGLERIYTSALGAIEAWSTGSASPMPAARAHQKSGRINPAGPVRAGSPPDPNPAADSRQAAASTTAVPARGSRAPVTHTRGNMSPPGENESHPRVTHTKAALSEPSADAVQAPSPQATASAASATVTLPAERRVGASKDQSAGAGCTEVVAALGFCSASTNREGK